MTLGPWWRQWVSTTAWVWDRYLAGWMYLRRIFKLFQHLGWMHRISPSTLTPMKRFFGEQVIAQQRMPSKSCGIRTRHSWDGASRRRARPAPAMGICAGAWRGACAHLVVLVEPMIERTHDRTAGSVSVRLRWTSSVSARDEARGDHVRRLRKHSISNPINDDTGHVATHTQHAIK